MAQNDDPTPLLEVRGLSKRFPGVLALQNVDMRINRGEVLAVIGENGAGKSTLMKILAGVQTPDSGEVFLENKTVSIDTVRDASAAGIALIHQELNLSDNLDVGANIFLGCEPRFLGLINRREIDRRSEQVLQQIGLDVSPQTIVETLSIGRQQMVEIAKALAANAKILIMDEPTSSLSNFEATRLFGVIRDLRDKGVSIVYISHRLGEVKEVADRVVVLRDGENVGELQREEIDHDRMVKLMVGRDISQFYSLQPHPIKSPILQVENLLVPGQTQHPLSFSVCEGEIVGLAGLVGAGRTELLNTLFGVDRAMGGVIRVAGKPVVLRSPRDAIAAKIALAPEDRKACGIFLEMTIRENITLAGLNRYQRFGMRNAAQERRIADEMINSLNIKTPSPDQLLQYLSGGNQQKVVLAKWLSLEPRILLLDEPTRGIDIGSKQEIYKMMEEMAERGVAILFASSEIEEIIGMSNRTLVMHQGKITGELQRSELSEEAIMQLATGNIKVSVHRKQREETKLTTNRHQ